MAKFEKRIITHELRRKGKSINEIAKIVGVSKGTVSVWCRDVKLTPTQKELLFRNQVQAGHKGRQLGAEMNKLKKKNNIIKQEKEAKEMIGPLSKRDQLMIGIGLYWGEGVKNGGNGAAMVNSDPSIVLFARNWFESIGIKRNEFNPYIYISEVHKNREQKVLEFWSQHLAIPKDQFNRIIFLKGRPKKVYENHDSYYGILALRIKRSTSLKYKILGLIKTCEVYKPR